MFDRYDVHKTGKATILPTSVENICIQKLLYFFKKKTNNCFISSHDAHRFSKNNKKLRTFILKSLITFRTLLKIEIFKLATHQLKKLETKLQKQLKQCFSQGTTKIIWFV